MILSLFDWQPYGGKIITNQANRYDPFVFAALGTLSSQPVAYAGHSEA